MRNKTELLSSFQHELQAILNYWAQHTVDHAHGGFFGRLNEADEVVEGAMKGAVLHARILWSFSAAYRYNRDERSLAMARRAYEYINEFFFDRVHGGVYWSVTAEGVPLDTRKQIYALAFTIYGLSEYFAATGDEGALKGARDLYETIESRSHDAGNGGYLEALTREWSSIDDLRLSEKDANEKKTMNTHLHILEAYTNLYRVWADEGLRGRLRGLLKDFMGHIVDPVGGHLHLFFDEDWLVRSETISYGHDIEASWLLVEAADVLEEEALSDLVRGLAIRIADAAAEGLADDGSMYYEREGANLIAERHWWVQAEAAVGFVNAWQMTGKERFYARFLGVWSYTLSNMVDRQHGEWYWGRKQDGSIMEGQDKAGFWKCPYHNSRACLELIRRLAMVLFVFLGMTGLVQAQRVEKLYRQIRETFYDSASSLYRETSLVSANERRWSYLWPLCALVQAGNELEVLEPGKSYLPGIMHSIDLYYSRKKGVGGYDSYVVADGGGDRFFDDNQWIGLAYMDAYRRTKTAVYLQRSEEIYRFMMTGYDTVAGGGLYWKEGDPGSKNTCSNGPGVLLALRLYQATKQKTYLDTALLIFDWTSKHLEGPDGIYYDAIRTVSGRIDSAVYTYNTGTMLQANVILYNITGKKSYLAEARRLAAASLRVFYRDGHFPNGPWFNAVLVRGYEELYAIDRDRVYLDAVGRDTERMWQEAGGGLTGRDAAKKMLDQAGWLEILARLENLHKRLRK